MADSSKKTILLTGASRGLGKETAKYFQARGWNVVATMRSPEKETELTALGNVLVEKLDVTKDLTIESAVKAAIAKFGKIDVLLNNAGYVAYGPLEATPMEEAQCQFDTNVIGLLAVTKEVLPHMRKNKAGVIINVSSIGGVLALPLGTLYHGSKFAVEGLSESLHFELEPVGIKVKIIQPATIKRDFGGGSSDMSQDASLEEYQPSLRKLLAYRSTSSSAQVEPVVVCEAIYEAATDGMSTLRYQAPKNQELITRRKEQGDQAFIDSFKREMGF